MSTSSNRMEVKIWGTRGSIPCADRQSIVYGGNTSSVTVRTPANTLMFLDAGTGMRYAAAELNKPAELVAIGITHTHADHIFGLGMSGLPYLNKRPQYQGKRVQLMGPPGIVRGLNQFYDGETIPVARRVAEEYENRCWPVGATDNPELAPFMPAIDFSNAIELKTGEVRKLDSSVTLKTLRGNHPVNGRSIFYRLETESGSVVYATDNEFDWLNGPLPNPNAEKFKEEYVEFVKGADILLADAQYTREKYLEKKPMDVRGWGHSYIDQVIDLAARAGVKKVMPTHHDPPNTDSMMAEIERAAKEYAKTQGYDTEVVFAREGMVLEV